jgi:glutathione synthase/RimK-type ligase-like ATP-grasp enzyme
MTHTARNADDHIVLVGSLKDEHIAAIDASLRELGHEPLVLDAMLFPADLHVSMGDTPGAIEVDGVAWSRPRAVYLRSIYHDPVAYGVDAEAAMAEDWRRTTMAFRERTALLSSMFQRWELLGVPQYNPPSAQVNITKPFQIALLQASELPVPATLWTNDPAAVKAFCREHEAIYKPVSGGARTRKVTGPDLEDERLAALAGAPVCFQELLPGEDVRVYVVDGRVVAALRIVASDIDFRQAEVSVEAFELPAEVAAQCVRACEVLGLRWTGMDLKRDRHGTLRILELNPSPMFLGFDQRAGTDIRGTFARALAEHLR